MSTPPKKTRGRAKPAPAPAPAKLSLSKPPDLFPIVGIGASAGGLEALEQFLRPIPGDSNMAFVIVQHLDPTRKGILPELLQRMTPMTVAQVQDRVKVQPNHIYVIPPNYDLSLLHGSLHLFKRVSRPGLQLPIDYLFRSLADDLRERSIGIILSGMGSDGASGLRAIKEAGGLALVQEPASAKFDGMPRSAIDTGLIDIIAPADALYTQLSAYLAHAPLAIIHTESTLVDDPSQSGLDHILILLRTHTGHDFSQYKKNTLYRRIERRMSLHQLDKISHYTRFMQENVQERDLLFKELLIGVTRFFRDPLAWAYLREQVIPLLLANWPKGGSLRAWVAGCSTGEEAYSLGILFNEALAEIAPYSRYSLQIFATDLDTDAIAKARMGLYPENISADVSPERLRRFFVKEESGGYRIAKEIREMVTFAPQNLIHDPPFTKMDLLICRNLLIYLTAELQNKLLGLFHYSLNSDGILFLGSAETVGSTANLFAVLEGKWRFYRRQALDAGARLVDYPIATTLPPVGRSLEPSLTPPSTNLQKLADQLLLQQFAPAAVLINKQGDILYISGRTGKYLEPAAGQVNWNLFAMARDGLHDSLLHGCRQAIHQSEPAAVIQRGLRVKTNGDYQSVDLTIQALNEPTALHGMLMVVFVDAPPPARKQRRKSGKPVADLEQEIDQLREALQSNREEMQSSQEELKSANEELQSTNEELQSTNEELVTSKEEMQSLNEELQTVNAELQAKLEELSRTSNDMKNLLNSTNIATLFLDETLHVRRFTIQAGKLINLIPGDVGRPVTDIASELIYSGLTTDVAEVLRTLVFLEKPIYTQEGRWFTVRIMPYRTLENRIDGVVLTYSDITASKTLEEELRQARDKLNALLVSKNEELDNLHGDANPKPDKDSPLQVVS